MWWNYWLCPASSHETHKHCFVTDSGFAFPTLSSWSAVVCHTCRQKSAKENYMFITKADWNTWKSIMYFEFQWCTVSAWLQHQLSIFQNGFLVGVQFKKSLKKWSFWTKRGVYSRKTQKRNFLLYLGLYSRVGLQSLWKNQHLIFIQLMPVLFVRRHELSQIDCQ